MRRHHSFFGKNYIQIAADLQETKLNVNTKFSVLEHILSLDRIDPEAKSMD